MGKIFISYSRKDTETVDRIAGNLRDAGMEVWIDREAIEAGDQWRVQIVEGINTCDAFVLMLSPGSAASNNVMKEVNLAESKKKTIFVVMLEKVEVPATLEYQLAGLQIIDVQKLGFEEAVSQLIGTVNKHTTQLKPVEEPRRRQAELVLSGASHKGFSPEKQEQLLELVSQLSKVSHSELKINVSRPEMKVMDISLGNLHVTVELPGSSAFELETEALNRDERFKKLGITALRLSGDLKFVDISSGLLTTTVSMGLLKALWLALPAPVVPVVVGVAVVITALLLKPGPPPGPVATATISATELIVTSPTDVTEIPEIPPTEVPATNPAPTMTPIIETSTPTPVTPVIPAIPTIQPAPPTPQSCTVTARYALNVRSEPNSNSSTPVLDWAIRGEILTRTDEPERNGWFQVTTPNGKIGWVYSIYCQ